MNENKNGPVDRYGVHKLRLNFCSFLQLDPSMVKRACIRPICSYISQLTTRTID